MPTYETHTNVMTEFAFTARAEYADPYNDIELDVPVAQDFQRAPGLASSRVVI